LKLFFFINFRSAPTAFPSKLMPCNINHNLIFLDLGPCSLDPFLKWPFNFHLKGTTEFLFRVKDPRPGQGFYQNKSPQSEDAPANSVGKQYWDLHVFMLE
jgi:hypothetical protein